MINAEPLPTENTESLLTANAAPLPPANTDLQPSGVVEPFSPMNTESFSPAAVEPLPTANIDPLATANTDLHPTAHTEPLSTANPEPLMPGNTETLPTAHTEPLSTANTDHLSTTKAEPIPTPLPTSPSLHIVVEKTPFLKALAHCQGVVERRNTVPILAHVLLETQQGALKITATDLEIAFSETFPAHIKTQGSTTVSAHLLFDVVRKLPEGAEIELKLDKNGSALQLQSGRSTYSFACLPAVEFPTLTAENLPCTFRIHGGEFARLIDRTRFSMSTEETRYYLNGICFHPTSDGGLRAVATDGLRLAQAQVTLPPEAAKMPQVIISRKTIHEIRKLIDETAEDVTISLSENQVRFTLESSVLISRLIEGKFPNYEQVIPFGNDKVLEVDVKVFADAIDRISTMSTDKLRPVKLRVEGTTMAISVHSSEIGSAVEELEVHYGGAPVDFGFNGRFILDVTQQITNSTLQFLIGDETQAIIAKDAVDESALYVLMPMRV